MHDHDPQPWQCDGCGHVNPWHVTMCPCEFWYPAEPAPEETKAIEWFRHAPLSPDEWREYFSNPSHCPECCGLGTIEDGTECPECKDLRSKQEEEPAPDLSQWLTVSIQDQEEESRERWSNAQPCPQCGTPMLYQDELDRGLCPMCWSKNRKEQ